MKKTFKLFSLLILLSFIDDVFALNIPKCPRKTEGSRTSFVIKDSWLLKNYAYIEFSCQKDQVLIGPSKILCRKNDLHRNLYALNNEYDENNEGLHEDLLNFPYCQDLVKEKEVGKSINNNISEMCKNPFSSSKFYYVGARINFKCTQGRLEPNNITKVVCQSDGNWSSSWPSCLVPCQLESRKKGLMQCSITVMNSTSALQLKSNKSTTTINPANFDEQRDIIPKCEENEECRSLECNELPSPPPNGIIMWLQKGVSARFECRQGYAINDGSKTTDLQCIFGTWSPMDELKCFKQFCPFLGLVTNGRLELHRKDSEKVGFDYLPYIRKVPEGAVATLKCQRGFKATGNGEIQAVCTNGRWHPSQLAECVSERRDARMKRSSSPCESVLRSTPHLKIDSVSSDAFEVSCDPGFELSSSSSRIECKSTSELSLSWQPSRPRCTARNCFLPSGPNHVFFVTMDLIRLVDNAQVGDNTRVFVQCEADLRPSTIKPLLCHRGKWIWTPDNHRLNEAIKEGNYEEVNMQSLSCNGRNCSLPLTTHLQYIGGRKGDWIRHGQSVTYKCHDENDVERISKCNDGILQEFQCTRNNEGGWMSAEQTQPLVTSQKRPCNHPDNKKNSNGNSEETFRDGTTITFGCNITFDEEVALALNTESDEIDANLGNETGENERNRYGWRLICEDGSWIGHRLSLCSNDSLTTRNSRSSFDSPCLFTPGSDANLRAFSSSSRQLSRPTRVAAGDIIYYRCRDIGKFRLEARRRQRVCQGGFFSPVEEPRCQSLSQMHDYDPDYKPTILFRVKKGHIGQTKEGWLAVVPGSIVHMECLFRRDLNMGSPMWRTENFSGRTYPQGWNNEPGRDARLEYRLSIYHARYNDTGVYTCMTPARKKHSVRVIVKEVQCPKFEKLPLGLTASAHNQTHLGATVSFGCGKNLTLRGQKRLLCQPSSQWNYNVPNCGILSTSRLCPESIITHSPPNLEVQVQSFQEGGSVLFTCKHNYLLRGQNTAICKEGLWSIKHPPKCVPLKCPLIKRIRHGKVVGAHPGNVRPGQTVEIKCQSPYKPNVSLMTCDSDGKWVGPTPKCTKACSFPGSVSNGVMRPIKFQYASGEVVEFECQQRLVGVAKIRCLPNGNWSSRPPICTN